MSTSNARSILPDPSAMKTRQSGITTAPVLMLRALEVRYGRRTILQSIDLDILPDELFVLVGPGGAGKSTLLRSICGFEQPAGESTIRGRLLFRGRAIGAGNRPELVGQKPPPFASSVVEFLTECLLADQASADGDNLLQMAEDALDAAGIRHLHGALKTRLADLDPADLISVRIARALTQNPDLLCLDEPTAGLKGAAAQKVRDLISAQRAKRAVLLVTHHLGEAKELGDRIGLLAGGRIVEQGSAVTFFDRPKTEAGRQFARSGNCSLPSPDTEPIHLSPENRVPKVRLPKGRPFIADGYGPKGFRWLIDGRLGATPSPGLRGEPDADLALLRRVGTTLLITFTDAPAVTNADAARFGMRQRSFPLANPTFPDPEAMIRIMAEAEREVQAGGAVVYHCGADVRRIGVVLVSHLIIRGMSVPQALALARQRNREWLPSLKQEGCLWDFELFLALQPDDAEGVRKNGSDRHGVA